MTDKELGFYDFDDDEWASLGGYEMELYCWSEIPNPEQFVKNKEWNVVKV